MADLKKILKGIIDASDLAAPLLGTQGAAGLKALKALTKLLKDAKGIAGPADATKLADIQAKVNAHADSTIAKLKGP